jgi:TonB family protein
MSQAQLTCLPQSEQGIAPPRLDLIEGLRERRSLLWYSTQTLSALVHAAVVLYFVHTGIHSRLFTQRANAGYTFGQAVMLASPLFELGDRNAVRGKQNPIPLSALVPERRLVAPDLRRIGLRPLDPPSGPASTERSSRDQQSDPSAFSLPSSGGGGGLPSGALPDQNVTGRAMPFDMVPPSNSRAPKPGANDLQRMVVGDASVPGGGAREGLRLPPSPPRTGTSIEIEVSNSATAAMEEYLRVLLSRLRRACFEAFPAKQDTALAGEVHLVLMLDRGGRLRSVETGRSSGSAALDRKARDAIAFIPAFPPLPRGYPEVQVRAVVRIRYALP